MPDWFVGAPEALPGDEFYMGAFWRLSTTRQVGFGFGPIPWHQIIAYAERYDLDHRETDVLVIVIMAMDEAWLNWHRKNEEKNDVSTDKGKAH